MVHILRFAVVLLNESPFTLITLILVVWSFIRGEIIHVPIADVCRQQRFSTETMSRCSYYLSILHVSVLHIRELIGGFFSNHRKPFLLCSTFRKGCQQKLISGLFRGKGSVKCSLLAET